MTDTVNGLSLLVPAGAEDRLKKLQRTCKKCGVALEQHDGQTTLQRTERRQAMNLETMREEWREVVLSMTFDRWTLGGFPGLSGYEFLCRIEHTQAGNIVSGPEPVEDWREAAPTCDHCRTKRRRNDTFVLRHVDSGEVVRVGRNCLADFLRADPTQLVRYSEACRIFGDPDEVDGEGFGFGCGRWLPDTETFLACAVASIERHGFVKSGEDHPTRFDAAFLAGPEPRDSAFREAWIAGQPTVAQREKAARILEWLQVACANEPSDYLSNLHVVSQLPAVSERHEGLLASAPVAWARAKEIDLRQPKAKEQLPPSEWLGAEKERVEFEGVLLRVVMIEGYWGRKALHVFRTDDGSDVAWFCQGHLPRRSDSDHWEAELDVGDRVRVKGTIKKLGEYKGRKQTTLTRCKVTYVAPSEPQREAS